MKQNLHTVYLSLGANIGDRRKTMEQAIKNIEKQIGRVTRQSAFYVTEPWGFTSPNKFLNAAICVETALCPHCILERTQQIERLLGRQQKTRSAIRQPSATGNESVVYHDRPIDIDILLYDDCTIDEPDLKIPHPLMHQRDFVMTPLREIFVPADGQPQP